ncbi:S8 family serine peptidase [bacterium]|nr:S8 family serine peptidase [bacterium]
MAVNIVPNFPIFNPMPQQPPTSFPCLPPNSFPGLPPLPVDRARRQFGDQLPEVPNQPPAGSLVIVDSFQDSIQADHGNVAAYAAKEHGFRGRIFAEKLGPDEGGNRRALGAFDQLNSGPLDAAKTRQQVQDVARFQAADLLNDVSGDLNKLRQRGLHDSAVNVSYGTTPVGVADMLVDKVRSGTNPYSNDHQLSQNILKAYNIDADKLGNPDPKIHGPERRRLHQSMLEAARAGFETPEVQQAKQNYDRAVHDLQSNHNSVVVSAGNQQLIKSGWAKEAEGLQVTSKPGDTYNVLANSEVTTVGATRWHKGPNGLRESVAGYSNVNPTVDVFASGSVATGQDQNVKTILGTSFSAPRVAGALATLHGNHPGASASQMRNLMNNRLTHELPGAGAPVLDLQAAEEYMRKGTF